LTQDLHTFKLNSRFKLIPANDVTAMTDGQASQAMSYIKFRCRIIFTRL